jgi:hypothetical protein
VQSTIVSYLSLVSKTARPKSTLLKKKRKEKEKREKKKRNQIDWFSFKHPSPTHFSTISSLPPTSTIPNPTTPDPLVGALILLIFLLLSPKLLTTRSGWLSPVIPSPTAVDSCACELLYLSSRSTTPIVSKPVIPIPVPPKLDDGPTPRPKNARFALLGPKVCDGKRLNEGLIESVISDASSTMHDELGDDEEGSEGLALPSCFIFAGTRNASFRPPNGGFASGEWGF